MMMIDNSSDVLANPVNSQSHSSRSHPLGGLNASAISKADLSPDAVSMLMTPREGDHQLYEEGVCGALSPRLPENYFPLPESISSKYILNFSGFSSIGCNPSNPAKVNQDSLIMVEDVKTGSVVIGCLDGHGVNGDILSDHFKVGIEDKLFLHPDFVTDPKTAIIQTLKSTEFELYNKKARLGDYSGTTLTLIMIRGSQVLVANVGDSRSILAQKATPVATTWEARQLSVDHKPDCLDEYNRILSAGGRVFAVRYADGTIGPPRVWLATVNTPGLAMSRSLGDFIAHTAGVVSKPDFYEFELSESLDCALICATDGVWDVMSNQEVVDMVKAHTQTNSAVDAIITESRKRWLKKEKAVDDTSIVIVRLKAPKK